METVLIMLPMFIIQLQTLKYLSLWYKVCNLNKICPFWSYLNDQLLKFAHISL